MGLDLGELELGVIGVHRSDLLPCGGAEHLDDLHELVDPRLPRELRGVTGTRDAERTAEDSGSGRREQEEGTSVAYQGHAQEELGHDTAHAPHVDLGRVVCGPKDELGGAVVSRAYVRDVGLPTSKLREHEGHGLPDLIICRL